MLSSEGVQNLGADLFTGFRNLFSTLPEPGGFADAVCLHYLFSSHRSSRGVDVEALFFILNLSNLKTGHANLSNRHFKTVKSVKSKNRKSV